MKIQFSPSHLLNILSLLNVDSSNVATGSTLIQQFPAEKRIIYLDSQIFDKAEQKVSTLHRELCGIVSAWQIFEHYIIGFPFPISLFFDHKLILYLWGHKGQLYYRFFSYQFTMTKFQKLKIIYTPGPILVFSDIRSRKVTIDQYKHHQLQHKELP